MARKHRFFTTYLTATFSVALLLLLIGLECVLAMSANALFRHIRENVTMSVVVVDEMTDLDSVRLTSLLDTVAFCHSYEFISKEQALQDHIENLGEDPTLFLDGYNPISASFEVKLNADYACADSVEMISENLSNYMFVEQVQYQRDMVDKLDMNIQRLTWILLGVAFILLLVSLALIVNTIRLHMSAKRFLIHTMQLVGATPWTIRGPIVRRTILLGLVASVLALAIIAGIVYGVYHELGLWLFPLTWQNMALLSVMVVGCGVVITFFASTFAVNKYIRMNKDELYNL